MIAPQLAVRPIQGISYGAEIAGVDLSRPLSDDVRREIVDTFYKAGFLLLRDQDLSPEAQLEAMKMFGEVARGENFNDKGVQGVGYISNTVEGGLNPHGELTFHFDHIYHANPLSVLSLYGIEVVPPGCGGETQFANLKTAYRLLPDSLKERIEGLQARHCMDYRYSHDEKQGGRVRESELRPSDPRATHPVAVTHPVTGEKTLYLGYRHTDRILDLPEDESEALIAELLSYAYRPENIYSHPWAVGDIIIWDNWCLQHARRDFDRKHRRHLQKVRIR